VWLATQPLHGEIELTPEMHQIAATQIAQFHLLEVLPDPFSATLVKIFVTYVAR
jgi:hypothetical protein